MPDQLSDAYPVLLGPVRVETRFTATDLLVRVFPDEWAVDAAEELPSEAEFSALTAYWTGVWRAAGDAGAERVAWQEFTRRVAPGRATWLRDTHRPANPADRPTGLPARTTALVVTTAAALPAADRQPTVTYWTAVWRAHGDRARLRAAEAALLAAVGPARARTVRGRPPAGIDAAPLVSDDGVVVAFLVVPRPTALAADSWTRAARARLLPDRITVLGFTGGRRMFSVTGAPIPAELAVGPDPAAEDKPRVDEDSGALHVPDHLAWLTDFDAAVAVGMGVRVPLDAHTRDGVDRLIVLGLRRGQGPQDSATALTALIDRQLRSPAGFALVPQGTPTNNTEAAPAGQDPHTEALAGLRTDRGAAPAAPADWTARTDGQCLAELLGIDPAALAAVPHADGTDQRDARAADTALWPATWGGFLRTALHPVVSDQDAARTRDFFLRHVSGRGPAPAVRIGRQPYGILPTTAFSRLTWPAGPTAAHRTALHHLLTAVREDWRTASARVARLDAGSPDPHQRLLDILALHPTSAEHHQRYARSVADLYNQENLAGHGPDVTAALTDRLHLPQPLNALLARLGYDTRPPGGPARPEPDLFHRLFEDTARPLLGPLVDDRPLSETDRLRPCTTPPAPVNYLHWLAAAGRRDLDRVRLEDGFAAGPPAALLYLLARHAVLLGWEETGRRLAVAAGRTPVPPVDPPFIHIRTQRPGEPAPPASESRYRQLYAPDPAVTGSTDPQRLVHQHVPGILGTHPATAELDEQLRAVALLGDLPTAKLERVLAEHLDCATYRFDAWWLGLANERLAELRYGPDGTGTPTRGLHLGCYGWLEDVRPRRVPLPRVPVPAALTHVFGEDPVPHDPANGGYVHAPSPGHARTAAVLRAGYTANGSQDHARSFAVNLSSERVRTALALLDGLRQGQSLGALLGHRFERGLHERRPGSRPDGVELDKFLPALRAAFPLRAGKLSPVVPGPGVPLDVVEARNVVDGLALVQRATRTPGGAGYPFGAAHMPPATPDEALALEDEVGRLLQLHDALGDLAVAESAHQALLGNTERASVTLDAYAKDGVPPEPAVVATPRGGTTLTHRFGIQLTAGLRADHLPPLYFGDSPRAKAEPAVNAWLPTLLPAQRDVAALVTWPDPLGGPPHERVVTQADLGLQPIDLLWAVRPGDHTAMTDLDDRIIGVVTREERPRPDVALTIRYTRRVPDKLTFFELSPLVDALRTLFTTSRPLRPTDLLPAAGTTAVDRSADDAVAVSRDRLAAVHGALTALRSQVGERFTELSRLYPAAPAPPLRAEVLARIDVLLAGYAQLCTTAGGFGMPRSGWGELTTWRREVYAALLAAVATAAGRMDRSLGQADQLLHDEHELPPTAPDEDRFRLLETAERLLTTTPTTPRPDSPAALRATVANRRTAFTGRLADLRSVARTGQHTLGGLLTEIRRYLPLDAFDPVGLDLTPFEDRIVDQGRELLRRTEALGKAVDERVGHADTALGTYDAAPPGPERVRCATDTLKALLGPDALVVPEFTPTAALAGDWDRARADSERLVAHLTDDFGRDFPVDDWLHGIARVRDKPRLWEKAVVLADALRGPGGLMSDIAGTSDPALTPVQLPYRPGDTWAAMEFKAGAGLTEDRVLFTAHYAPAPPGLPTAPRCGLLFDEWTEVVPSVSETTSIALHYDGPDSEPPQAMLLVVPPARTGTWNEDDLVAAVQETLDLAALRAVEPDHLDGTAYAHLLPATVLSATRRPITISTDLALGNLRGKTHA
ncbi:hypothetical protein [Streptomyces sp. WAC06614]|uniref:hypothetical protein n=1 Tax=Streptomyces sp. WAC06614 TaxID=2487416 RepID=UPI00163C6DEA|nr:hypothetical protein [Streptomyces sp. WAC06614]